MKWEVSLQHDAVHCMAYVDVSNDAAPWCFVGPTLPHHLSVYRPMATVGRILFLLQGSREQPRAHCLRFWTPFALKLSESHLGVAFLLVGASRLSVSTLVSMGRGSLVKGAYLS